LSGAPLVLQTETGLPSGHQAATIPVATLGAAIGTDAGPEPISGIPLFIFSVAIAQVRDSRARPARPSRRQPIVAMLVPQKPTECDDGESDEERT
jgi:hypothetical protein